MPSKQAPEPLFRPLGPEDPRRLGDYQLRAQLGAGGMGRVYLGATSTGRRLAVKVVRGEFAEDAEFRDRFRREIDAAQRVRGPYTAAVVDADAEADHPWLATEYVPGPSLAAAVAGHGPLPEATLRVLVAGIAEALYAVHRAGVVHRDLKPSNVLLGPSGPCVIDFGIARAADAAPLTRTGHQVGTPLFMAPEQVRGEVATQAADIWALGAIAYFAATGAKPFGEGPDGAVLYRVVHEEPQLDRCPAYLRPLVAGCLDKDPTRRPSVRAILEQFPAPADVRGWLPDPLGVAVAQYSDTPPGPIVVPVARSDSLVSMPPPTPSAAPPTVHSSAPRTVPPGAGPAPAPGSAKRGRRRAVLVGVASFVLVLAAGGVAAVLIHRAQSDGGGDGGGGGGQATYRLDRQITETGGWQLVLTDIVVNGDTMTAHVEYRNQDASDPGLTCLLDSDAGANSVEYADGTVVKSTETYCSQHPDRTWSVDRGQSWTGYAVFPAPTSGQSFTLHWEPDNEPSGDVSGITLH